MNVDVYNRFAVSFAKEYHRKGVTDFTEHLGASQTALIREAFDPFDGRRRTCHGLMKRNKPRLKRRR